MVRYLRDAVMWQLVVVIFACPAFAAEGSPSADEHLSLSIEPDIVSIPAGLFVMGGDGYPGPTPLRLRWVRAFGIGRYEVRVGEYERFLRARDKERGSRSIRPWEAVYGAGLSESVQDDPSFPCSGVTWAEAKEYATWLAACTGRPYRLLTDVEWEYAAAGPERRKWPWGDSYSRDFFNGLGVEGADTFGGLAPVGSFPKGATRAGVFDLSGNVKEWCDDVYCGFAPTMPGQEICASEYRITRGGSAYGGNAPTDQTTLSRQSRAGSIRTHIQGFRLALDLPGSAHQTETDLSKARAQLDERLTQVPVGSQSPPWVLLHTLLAFGSHRVLPDSDVSGEEFLPMLALIGQQPGLWEVANHRIAARLGGRPNTFEDHPGQALYVFSQIGVPASFLLVHKGLSGDFTLNNLLWSELDDVTQYSDNSWILPGLVYYCGNSNVFSNRFGEKLSCEILARHLLQDFAENGMSNPYSYKQNCALQIADPLPCFGTHCLYALTYLLWYDDHVDVIGDETAARIRTFLDTRSAKDLEEVSKEFGSLVGKKDEELKDTLFPHIWSIGHRLEWIAMWIRARQLDPRLYENYYLQLASLATQGCEGIARVDNQTQAYSYLCHSLHALDIVTGFDLQN